MKHALSRVCGALSVALLVLAIPGAAHAQLATYNTTDKSGTITTGGTAQTAIAANQYRRVWCIQNDPSETENLTVRVAAAATTTAGTVLTPGTQACNITDNVDRGIVSVLAATTGHKFRGFEGE